MVIDSTIIVALITLSGVIISAFITRNNLLSQLEKKDALMEQRLEQIDKKLEIHNNYSALFHENLPVIKEQLKQVNERLDKVEAWEHEHNGKIS